MGAAVEAVVVVAITEAPYLVGLLYSEIVVGTVALVATLVVVVRAVEVVGSTFSIGHSSTETLNVSRVSLYSCITYKKKRKI